MSQEDKSLGTIDPQELEEYDLVDVYVTYNFAEADLIRDILSENEIDNHIRKLEPPQFPVNTGHHGQIRVDVPTSKVQDAIAVLKEAIEAEALTDEGKFLVEEE